MLCGSWEGTGDTFSCKPVILSICDLIELGAGVAAGGGRVRIGNRTRPRSSQVDRKSGQTIAATVSRNAAAAYP